MKGCATPFAVELCLIPRVRWQCLKQITLMTGDKELIHQLAAGSGLELRVGEISGDRLCRSWRSTWGILHFRYKERAVDRSEDPIDPLRSGHGR